MTGPTLLLDIGNSRTKWALVQGSEWIAEGASAHADIGRLLSEWDRFPSPSRIIVSNVAGAERLAAFSAYWQSRATPLHCIKTGVEYAGVRNLYDHPELLGSDRWAALIAAWARTHGACLVVSAGTAVTIDALNGQGEFMGGMILPGKRLMQQSLASGTHALENLAGEALDFPRNTADAMASGIASALACAVQTGYQRLARASAHSPSCIITGGDAEWLVRHTQIGAIIAPKLVLEGLLIMDQGNAQK